MLSFLSYDIKAAVALAVFYMFYRLLLRKETFHRLNRAVLVGTAVLAFILPFCIITIHKPIEMETLALTPAEALPEAQATALESLVEVNTPWWPLVLAILFWTGVALVLARVLVSILSIFRIIKRGQLVRVEDGSKVYVTERDIDPFSWMKYIVLSRKDWEGDHAPILAHEKAHIGFGHTFDLLVVDILSAIQWFNPAVWMLRADLQELHEYEADDAVLRAGADIKEYQYLLIRKAVSKSGYSVANSFNHSILKNRITMMSKSKSPLARGLRALYLLPLVCLGIGLQAQTVYVPVGKDSEKNVTTEDNPSVFQEPQSDVISLTLRADGIIGIGGQEITLDQLKDYFNPDNQTVVQLCAEKSVPMGVIEDVRDELRRIGALKLQIRYFLPSNQDYMVPLPPTHTGKTKNGLTELYPGVNRENICIVRINSRDKIFFGNKASQDEEEMLRLGKGFLREHGKDTRFSLQADRGTSYGAYLHMQNLLVRLYREVREETAQSVYGKSLSDLTPEERSQINWMFPIGISEAEMKNLPQKR